MPKLDNKTIVILIFVLAVAIRLLYFPQNVEFAFDQARDAYASLDILRGDLKLIGPPSFASDKLFPGPLIFYLTAPVNFLFGHNPEGVSLFLRVVNSLGVFLVFFIGLNLFNRGVGVLAAIFFAFSYEQTQYSLFTSHQPLAVISILLFYLGLTLLIFKKKPKGLILAVLGCGLSIQFHYLYLTLLPALFLFLFIFRKELPAFDKKIILASMGTFLACVSTFILAELKFHFRFLQGLLSLLNSIISSGKGTPAFSETIFFVFNRFLRDNIFPDKQFTGFISLFILLTAFFMFLKKAMRPKIIFLFLWLGIGFLPYLFSDTKIYYYSAAASVSLIILVSFALQWIFSKQKVLGAVLIILIIGSNLYKITTENKAGPSFEIIIQPGMLLTSEKQVLDYIYHSAKGEPFSVNALTVPLKINTTWSYLFEWYGESQYHYLPVWGGEVAVGFPGNLKVITQRSALPELRYVISEPPMGINPYEKEKFFREENYFSKVTEEKNIGVFVVQKRIAI